MLWLSPTNRAIVLFLSTQFAADTKKEEEEEEDKNETCHSNIAHSATEDNGTSE